VDVEDKVAAGLVDIVIELDGEFQSDHRQFSRGLTWNGSLSRGGEGEPNCIMSRGEVKPNCGSVRICRLARKVRRPFSLWITNPS
jgi:hypothetical protein